MNSQRELNEQGVDWNRATREHALEYVKKFGWYLVPIHSPRGSKCSCGHDDCDKIGKHPRIKEWQKNCSNDPKVINQWFDWWPDMNIAVATGPNSNLIAIDADGLRGKRTLMMALTLPYTLSARSGDGVHYYFKYPKGYTEKVKTKAGMLPNVDSRAEGGYILLAPSLHRKGFRYEWLDSAEIATAPQIILDMLTANEQEHIEVKFNVKIEDPKIDAYGKAALQDEIAIIMSCPIGLKLRNKTFYASCCRLYRLVAGQCLDEATVDELVMNASEHIKMEHEEALKTRDSAKKWAVNFPRTPKETEVHVRAENKKWEPKYAEPAQVQSTFVDDFI